MKKFIQDIGWEVLEENKNPSGQATIYYVTNKSGESGVFRMLKFKDNSKFNQESIERFHREIKVLTSVKSENIIEIIDYGESIEKKIYWYISRKGEPFEAWWNRTTENLTGNKIYELATEVITQIANGLAVAHKNNIVHRDLKPDNLVVIDNQIKIIDWGICHIQGAERITDIDFPAYNRAFSPSYLYFYRKDVPTWVDIFQLSQLLIYLLREEQKKKIFAPIHWKWVVYKKDIDKENVLKCSIFLNRCSDESTCPSNGTEAIELIKNVLTIENSSVTMSELNSLFSSYLKLKSIESDTDIKTKIENLSIDIAPAIIMYNQLVESIDQKIRLLKEEIAEIRIERKRHIDSISLYSEESRWNSFLTERLKNNPNAPGGNDLGICIEFGFEPLKTIRLTIIFKYDLKNEFIISEIDLRPKLSMIIKCEYRNRQPIPNHGFTSNFYIIDPTLLMDTEGNKVNFTDIKEKIISTIESTELWKASEK